MAKYISAVLAGALLVGCGAGDTSSVSSSATAASKQLTRGEKVQAANYATVVQELYVAYFGRPADPAGLLNFENALLAAGAPTDIQDLANAYATNSSVQALVNSFGNSAESQALYGNGSTTAFVTAVFSNVLGRQPLSSGLNYWVDAITSGTLSQGDAALSIMAGGLTNTSAQGQLDATLINNRLAVAAYFSVQVLDANAVNNYSGSNAAASARSMLGSVIATTNTTSFEATANATINGFAVNAAAITTYAGNGNAAIANGADSAASFNFPAGVAVDAAGNVYVADTFNNVIRKISINGQVATFSGTGNAGNSNGTATQANFNAPRGVAVDSSGNVYVADTGNRLIRKINAAGTVTTLAGNSQAGEQNGTGTAASFSNPSGLTVDASGNVYVADTGNNAIRKITSTGVVSTFASNISVGNVNGTGVDASIYSIAVDTSGNLYVPDTNNNLIRKITATGVISILAGSSAAGSANGAGTVATFFKPAGVAVDVLGNVYVADTYNNMIRKISPTGVVITLAGNVTHGSTNANGAAASFYMPGGLAINAAGTVYVADTDNNLIRKITQD